MFSSTEEAEIKKMKLSDFDKKYQVVNLFLEKDIETVISTVDFSGALGPDGFHGAVL